MKVQVIWAQMVGLSIKGAVRSGLDIEQAGAYIEDIIDKHPPGQRLNIRVSLPNWPAPLNESLRRFQPLMVD